MTIEQRVSIIFRLRGRLPNRISDQGGTIGLRLSIQVKYFTVLSFESYSYYFLTNFFLCPFKIKSRTFFADKTVAVPLRNKMVSMNTVTILVTSKTIPPHLDPSMILKSKSSNTTGYSNLLGIP